MPSVSKSNPCKFCGRRVPVFGCPCRRSTRYANLNSRVTRLLMRRRNPLSPATKARINALKRAEPSVEQAGFNKPEHYNLGGVPSYCKCGTVAEHNAAFDKLVEERA